MPDPDIISLAAGIVRRGWSWSVDYADPTLSRSGDAASVDAAMTAVGAVIEFHRRGVVAVVEASLQGGG
jgi:hypothetical protein